MSTGDESAEREGKRNKDGTGQDMKEQKTAKNKNKALKTESQEQRSMDTIPPAFVSVLLQSRDQMLHHDEFFVLSMNILALLLIMHGSSSL